MTEPLTLDLEIRIESDYDPDTEITTWTAHYQLGAISRQFTHISFVECAEFVQRRLADIIATYRVPRADQPARGA